MKRCHHLAFSVGKGSGRIEAFGFEKDRGRVRGGFRGERSMEILLDVIVKI